jgi:hypothetical protein
MSNQTRSLTPAHAAPSRGDGWQNPSTPLRASLVIETEFLQADLQRIQGPVPDESQVRATTLHALILSIVFAVVIVGSASLTFWAFGMLPNDWLRMAATLALVGTTVGSMEVALSHSVKGSVLVLVLAVVVVSACMVVHYQLGQARAAMIVASLGSGPLIEGMEAPVSPQDAFLSRMQVILAKTVPMLAFALELGSGLLLAQILAAFCNPQAVLIRRREKLRLKILRILRREELGPFWTRERLLALAVLGGVVGFFLFAPAAYPATVPHDCGTRVGILIDLTLSRSPQALAADIRQADQALSETPLGACVLVAGITDDGFGASLALLETRLTRDPGWMNGNLNRAHALLHEAWKQKSAALAPRYQTSDIIGAIVHSVRQLGITAETPGDILVLTDARQSHGVNIGNIVKLPGDAVQQAKQHGLVADLSGARIAIAGLTTDNRSICYFDTLKGFWVAWARASGASLVNFSISRVTSAHEMFSGQPLTYTGMGACPAADTQPVATTRPVPPLEGPHLIADVRISSPLNRVVVGHEELVEGWVRDASSRVVLVVRPKTGQEYWCAEAVSIDSSGHFSGTVYFGRSPALDGGVVFQLRAIAGTSACQNPGDKLNGWPQGQQSIAVEVTRR